VESVGDSGGGGFVDDVESLEAGRTQVPQTGLRVRAWLGAGTGCPLVTRAGPIPVRRVWWVHQAADGLGDAPLCRDPLCFPIVPEPRRTQPSKPQPLPSCASPIGDGCAAAVGGSGTWEEGVGWGRRGGVVISSLERVGDLAKEGHVVEVGGAGEGWGIGIGVMGNG
jgi:hypothetical protein